MIGSVKKTQLKELIKLLKRTTMKKIVAIAMVMLLLGFASANAQETESAVKKEIKKGEQNVKKAGKEIKKDTKKAANKTAEVASKGKSKVVDKTYKDKVGPNGETIYIDKYSKYYWVDEKGHKKYVDVSELKDK
jgi:hypothetical protein